ncbi:ATP synthase I subunit [Methylophaga lonarensis MPL]|uniref:ATP synthase I subunit n=2 Tax=Methylophaga lonarensis TaxID=999151 RepID=M7NTH9_9GAMM|nr:ATP synthase I subunit [Methylophaga lonarensis MPL]
MEQLTRVKPVNQLLKTQFIVLLIIVASVFWLYGKELATAVCFGGLISVSNTLLLKWHLLRTAQRAGASPMDNLSGAYRCIVERWILTIAMFAVGFAVLQFTAAGLLLGFVAMQVVLLFGYMKQA